MPKIYILAFLLLALNFSSEAQRVAGTVKGTLQDSSSAAPLSDATVSVMRAKDSSLISFSITNSRGSFQINNVDAGQYILIASYTGLQTIKKPFTISAAHTEADLGVIKMSRHYKSMDAVVIQDLTPVMVKGDTLAYNANAFKTKPNATVEDLIKKLPGMSVERDGTVKAQGEQVQKVYVDGKEFFSNDPKLATKNLTADMVDQVEVFDDMSEQAKFNRIDDGSRSKALNLKLKKDKKKGVFGKAYAGYGTQERFDVGLNANFFKGATQTSVIAKNNNTNNIGFSFSDMIGMFNSGGMSGAGGMGGMNIVSTGRGGFGNLGGSLPGLNLGTTGSGVTKSSQVGLNYRDTWSKSFDVNGSYFFNHVNTDNNRTSLRTTMANDSTLLTDDHTISKAENDNHRFNWNMIYSIDSFNSIIYNPSLTYQKSYNTHSLDTLHTDAVKDGATYRTNESRTLNNRDGDGYSWTNNLIWRRRFRKAGRTLSVNLNNTLGESTRNAYTTTDARFYTKDAFKWMERYTNQLNKTLGETNNYTASLSYTEPIARDKMIEVNYSHSDNRNTSDRRTSNYDAASGEYKVLIDSLTNNFQNRNVYDRVGANFRVVKKKYNYQLGFAVQQTDLESNNLTTKKVIRQTANNLFPTASFNYQFARSRSLRINYRGSTRQPSTTQLQDITDVTGYPYITRGNPSLKQEFTNNVSLSYNFFDIIKFRNLFAFVTFNNTQNKIATAIEQLPGGVQVSKPVNLDGAYMVNGTFNMGFPIKRMQGGNFNTNTRVTYNRDVSLLNNVKNFTNNMTLGEDLRLSYNWKEKLDLGLSASVNYTSQKYTLQPKNNTSYYTHTYSADATYTFPKGFILSTDFDYTFNTGLSNNFNRNYAIWNGSLAKEVFKSKRGEVKVSVFDILGQNVGVTRNTGLNYYEDVQSSVLNRFFMLTFTYKLNRMGGRTMPAIMERATRGMRVTM